MGKDDDYNKKIDQIQEQLKSLQVIEKEIHEIKSLIEMTKISAQMADNRTQLEGLKEAKRWEEEIQRSKGTFYYGIFIGTLLGIIGNFLVSFWFAPITEYTVITIGISGALTLITLAMLWRKVNEYLPSRIKTLEEKLNEQALDILNSARASDPLETEK